MPIDFVSSRMVMIVGGLLLAGAAAGTYTFMTSVPQAADFDIFAQAYVKPLREATLSAGGSTALFSFHEDVEDALRLPTTYKGKALSFTLYRNGAVLEADGKSKLVPFIAEDRIHLWFATNVREYGAADFEPLDGWVRELPVDYTKPLAVTTAGDAAGNLHVHLWQSYWVPSPWNACRVYLDEGKESNSCPDPVSFTLVDALGEPVPFEMEDATGPIEDLTPRANGFDVTVRMPDALGPDPVIVRAADPATAVSLPVIRDDVLGLPELPDHALTAEPSATEGSTTRPTPVEFTIDLTNEGGEPLNVRVVVTPPEDGFTVEVDPPELEMDIADAATVTVRILAEDEMDPGEYAFEVAVDVEEAEDLVDPWTFTGDFR